MTLTLVTQFRDQADLKRKHSRFDVPLHVAVFKPEPYRFRQFCDAGKNPDVNCCNTPRSISASQPSLGGRLADQSGGARIAVNHVCR